MSHAITFRSHAVRELDQYVIQKTPIEVWDGVTRVDQGILVAYWRSGDIWEDGTYVVAGQHGLHKYSGIYQCADRLSRS